MRPRSHGGTGRTAGGDAKRVVEASLNLIGAIIRPWRGVQDATSVDRKSRSHDRCTANSPCSRRVILGTPSRRTRPIRADRRIPVRAPPSAPRFRSIRCAKPTRQRPVRTRREWWPKVARREGQRRGRWIMRLPRRASLLLLALLLTSAATAHAECAWVLRAHGASDSSTTSTKGSRIASSQPSRSPLDSRDCAETSVVT